MYFVLRPNTAFLSSFVLFWIMDKTIRCFPVHVFSERRTAFQTSEFSTNDDDNLSWSWLNCNCHLHWCVNVARVSHVVIWVYIFDQSASVIAKFPVFTPVNWNPHAPPPNPSRARGGDSGAVEALLNKIFAQEVLLLTTIEQRKVIFIFWSSKWKDKHWRHTLLTLSSY